jgi:hypothetical protein
MHFNTTGYPKKVYVKIDIDVQNITSIIGQELRGFAPIGILEYWNIGMMGSAVL